MDAVDMQLMNPSGSLQLSTALRTNKRMIFKMYKTEGNCIIISLIIFHAII